MDLLNAIWDDAPGRRAVLYKKAGQKIGGRNEFFDTNQAAWDWLLKKNREGFEVWFGMALFDTSGRRKQTNVTSVKSFWLDIDVGEEKPYSSIDEAATALASFCDKLNLPLPTLVHSGSGLHAHWIMAERLDKLRWERTAKALKNACGRHTLRVGPERTADVASVLRVPGTNHLKDTLCPKPVRCIGEIQAPASLVTFEAALAPYVVIDNKQAANKVFEANLPQLPYDAEKIANECGVIATMRDTKGCVSEPIWYGVLQVLGHCIDGEDYAHRWSEGYDGYSYQLTEQKFERAQEFGPTLCSRFGELSDACNNCRHKGKITTPLQLGRTFTPVTISANVGLPGMLAQTDGLSGVSEDQGRNDNSESLEGLGREMVDQLRQNPTKTAPEFLVPPHYQVGAEGVAFINDDADDKIERILDVPLWVSQLTDTVREADMEATVEWVTRIGRHRTSTMRVDTLMDLRATGMWLASRGITGFSIRGLEAVKNYVWACIQTYQRTKDVDTVYEHFGWTGDGSFVLGDSLISAVSVDRARLANRIPAKMRLKLTTKGTLEAWAQATESLRSQKYIPHQFTLVASLGSVLFSLMGVSGAVLSLAGDSGVGKTTIGLFGLSAFGKADTFEMSPQSTERSFHELWYIASNLPVIINEAATLDLYKLSSLIYAAANGHARSTLTRNSELRESDGWQLLTIFTSNSHLMSLDEKWLNDANRRRILEFILSKPEHEMDRSVALVLHNTMKENYGIAGRLFIQHCVNNRQTISQALQSSYDLYAKGDVPVEHRFNLWTIAVARVAGLIGEQLGILRFDTTPCYEWAVEQVKSTARLVLTPEQKGDELFADYITGHQGLFTEFNAKTKFWNTDIRGECAGRYRIEDGSLSLAVPANKFAVWMRERGMDRQHLDRWMQARGIKKVTGMIVAKSATMKVYQIPIEGTQP